MVVPTFINLFGTLLDPNSFVLVTPTISSPNYMYCTVSIIMTVTKNGSLIADGFVEFIDITDA